MAIALRNRVLSKPNSERGVGLLLALFGIVFLSGYILININVDRDRILRERVDQTAWLINELAQAARLYVRDKSASGNPVFQKTALCTTPVPIPLTDLITNGYLGADIGNKNTGNVNAITPLGQTVHIIAANSQIDTSGGSCSTPASLSDLAATAYIIMQPTASIDPAAIPFLAEALSNEGLPVSPPIFDIAGNNISPACGGGAGTIQWNTGCLTSAQYSFLLPAIPFANNTIGLPAWLGARGDTRAVFRYDQAENPQARRMQTDLRMAPMADTDTTTCTQVNIRSADNNANPTASVLTASGVCSVTDDDASGVDNRRDIIGLNNLGANRVIVTPQAIDVGGVDAATPLRITGNATITGNVRSFATSNSVVTGGNLDMSGANPGLAITAGATGVQPRMQVNTLQAANLQGNTGTITGGTNVSGNSAITTMQVDGSVTVADPGSTGRGVVINQLQGTAVGMTIAGEAAVGGTTQVLTTSTATGGGSLSLATARLDARNTQIQGNVSIGNDLVVEKDATIDIIESTASSVNSCLGDCPDRQTKPEPPL